MTFNDAMAATLKEMFKTGMVIKPREDGCYSVHPPTPGPAWFRRNDALTLADAHRLLSVLRDETQSRSVLAECEDVMARLERMVER
jgi:hypothetical protein